MSRTVDPLPVEQFSCPWTNSLWKSVTLEILWNDAQQRWYTQIDYGEGYNDTGAYLDVVTHRLWKLNPGLREAVIEKIKARAALFLECWL
jgi:hypothetical protein